MELIDNLPVKESSKKIYKYAYKKLQSINFVFFTDDVDVLKNKFSMNQNFITPNQKLLCLNLIIVLYKKKEMNIDSFLNYRTELTKKNTEYKYSKLKEKKKELIGIDYKRLKLELKNVYDLIENNGFNIFDKIDKARYIKYIINFLFLNFCCRNADVNVKILKEDDGEGNRLIINKENVMFIRRDYKTFKTYGQKNNKIKNEKFLKVIQHYYKKYPDEYLLTQDKHTLFNQLRKYLILELKENEICKLVIDYHYKNEDTAKIRKIGEYRGTSIPVLEQNYNLNIAKKIIC